MDNQPADLATVARISERLVEAGSELLAISDTAGTARPEDIRRVSAALDRATGLEPIGIHLHDRYGLGITNSYVAYECGGALL